MSAVFQFEIGFHKNVTFINVLTFLNHVWFILLQGGDKAGKDGIVRKF